MNMPQYHRSETAERLMEIDQELREAVDRRDGVAVRCAAKRQSLELKKAMKSYPHDEGGWIREAADRLSEMVVHAKEAQRVIGAQISGVDVQRRLVGAPMATLGRSGSRSFWV